MFGFFVKKKDVENLKHETKKGFDSVKNDMNSIGVWIKHLDSEKHLQKKEIEKIRDVLSTMNQEITELKNIISVMNSLKKKNNFQTAPENSIKQTGVYSVQTGVQTGVQTPNFDQFSTTERAIIWTLLNSDLKLSYEDLAAVLGKEKSTIRGQINSIRQKSDILEEMIEKNGKKRVFIQENVREKLLKKSKVRVGDRKKFEKN